MKKIFFLMAFLLTTKLFAQTLTKQKEVIDSIVSTIDRDQTNTLTSFRIQALKKVLHYINYNYLSNKSSIVKIDRRFKQSGDSVFQHFYFKKGQLIYSTEYILTYYSDKTIKDTMIWASYYYFDKNRLIDYSTLGHGKSESDDPNSWDPQSEVLNHCNEAKRDIQRNKVKNGG